MIHGLLLFQLFVWDLCLVLALFFSTLCPSSVAITFMGKKSWLLYFNCVPAVSVLSLFLTVPCVGLQCVIVVFPIHTYFFEMISNTI